MSLSATIPVSQRPDLSAADYGLYGATIFAWGFSWIAMKGQIGSVPPEVSVFWRFVLASAVMFAWSHWRGHNLRFPLADHLRFIGLGALIFSTNFTLFYYGAASLPSGLLAVVFSLASVLNLFLSMVLFGQRPSGVALLAGVIGFSGIALMFKPQIMATGIDYDALRGLVFCALGTLSFCFGNMLSASNQKKGLGVTPATTWGMLYGTLLLGAFAALKGSSFAIETTPAYLGSLAYLAIIASVVAFGSYLTLLGRIGSAKAGYATVIFPVVALTVSTVFENYQWTTSAMIGLACVMCGNILMLRSR
ncbi:DMT family transporter [Roseibium sp.]|uniref:DMT family transporter n=1 Tax=Roseibium sp. TaxID=1936156 RepID=UPI003A97BF8D